ncbi:MAG: hypothetical protein AB7S38_29030 [Vulcanimicrobiota bacterium]
MGISAAICYLLKVREAACPHLWRRLLPSGDPLLAGEVGRFPGLEVCIVYATWLNFETPIWLFAGFAAMALLQVVAVSPEVAQRHPIKPDDLAHTPLV